MNQLVIFLSEHIKLKQVNSFVYTANRCLFCDGKGEKILRINTKIKVVKCYNCGFSAKDVNYLKKLYTDKQNYQKWLKITKGLNRCIVEKEWIDDGFNFPF